MVDNNRDIKEVSLWLATKNLASWVLVILDGIFFRNSQIIHAPISDGILAHINSHLNDSAESSLLS